MTKQISTERLVALNARQEEVFKRVCNGGLPIEAALIGTQGILDGIYPPKDNNFPQFNRFLKDRSSQLTERRRLNKELPKILRVSDLLFDNVDSTSGYCQMVEDCEFLFVSLGDFRKTQKSIRELTQLTHGIRLSGQFREDENNFCLHETAADYFYAQPGFYWVRINLMANWNPGHGRSVDRVWQKSIGTKLNAGSLGDAALVLQNPELRRMQNGKDFPYFDHTDIQVFGDGFSRAPGSGGCNADRGVEFFSSDSGCGHYGYSAPTLVE